MRGIQTGVFLAMVACGSGAPPDPAQGSDTDPTPTDAETAANKVALPIATTKDLPPVALSEAPGVVRGTPLLARGIEIGQVTQTRLAGERVLVDVRLEIRHDLRLTTQSCVSLTRDPLEKKPVLVLHTGTGEAAEPEEIAQCPGSASTPTPTAPLPSGEASAEEPAPGADPAEGADDAPKTPKIKVRRTAGKCGDHVTFSTQAVRAVEPKSLHLPKGGWQAKIKFMNDGPLFVSIAGVTQSVFKTPAGEALPVATIPEFDDWFQGFELPPKTTKVVTVTFHKTSEKKPWVERIKYSLSCD